MSTTGMKFVHSAHIAPQGKPKSHQNQMWAMLAGGLVFGFMGMYYTVTKPMTARIQHLESNIVLMQTEMHQLVGTRDDLWKTNDLLTGLRQQQRQMAEAEQALVSLRQMKNEVLSLAAGNEQATASLDQIHGLQQNLIESHMSLLVSQDALAQLRSLQKEVAQLGTQAESQEAQIAKANAALANAEALAQRTIEQSAPIQSAQTVLDSVDQLTDALSARQPALAESSAIVGQVEALQNELTKQAEKLPAAASAFEQMAALENRLAQHDSANTEKAEANLAALANLEMQLSSGTNRITTAIQTIELLEDFQQEIERHATSLTNMRRDLMEITFLESTVNQTLRVLKPLIQLTDIRRMSDVEVREAARVIMDRRIADNRHNKDGVMRSRIAEKIEETETVEEQKVPNPIELN